MARRKSTAGYDEHRDALAQAVSDGASDYGEVISEGAALEISSASRHNCPEDHGHLFRGHYAQNGYAFHTAEEKNPWAKVDLGAVKNIRAVAIHNRPGERRTEGLVVSTSADGEQWTEAWRATEWREEWVAMITRFHAGIEVPGRPARYLKLETRGDSPRPLLLQRVTVYGDPVSTERM